MATLVRIKRHLDEEPLDALVLKCKKRKICVDEKENVPENMSTLLQFAGTVQQDENIQSLLKIRNISDLKELKDQFKKPPKNLNDKLRAQIQETSKNNRFKVVNCFRSSNLEFASETISASTSKKDIEKSCSNSSSSSKKEENCTKDSDKYTVFDIETDVNENDNETENLNNTVSSQYVYDVYYADSYSDDVGQAHLGDFDSVSIYPLNDPLIFGSVRDNGLDETVSDNESEDSNAECNWRNDYPDESDMESINEDDMVKAVKNLDIGEDLSSDTEDENFVYSVDDDEPSGEVSVALDEDDVKKYGATYAKFKARHKNIETKGLDKEFYYGDIDEEEYYY